MTCHRVNVIHSIVTRLFNTSANSADDANLFDPQLVSVFRRAIHFAEW